MIRFFKCMLVYRRRKDDFATRFNFLSIIKKDLSTQLKREK